MLQVNPQKYLPLVYQLLDPTDTNTYYVQAVIKNSLTDTTLTTVNLTDQSGQRFTGSWQTDADPSGEGYYIDIIYTVYTNSGYTITGDYQKAVEGYFVHELWGLQFGHGGGADIDYKKLGRLMDKKLSEKFGTLPPPKPVDFSEVLIKLADIEMAFVNLVIPGVDYERIANYILDVRKMVEAIPTEHADRSDINEEVIKGVKTIQKLVSTSMVEVSESGRGNAEKQFVQLERVATILAENLKEIKDHFDNKKYDIEKVSIKPINEQTKKPFKRNNKPSLLRK